jgi:diguanylate cyclase (GGDEF)-like protein
MLIVGGAGLVAVARRSLPAKGRRLIEIVTACIAVVSISLTALSEMASITSSLLFYLLIPVFVFVAQRGDQYLVMLLGCSAMVAMLLFGVMQPTGSLSQPGLGVLYLDVALLWVIVFTGMVTSSARQEMRTREQVSWLAMHDPLTRLLNRHALMERLEDLLQRDAGGGHVLMYMDLDRFKDLNDAEGHRAGDHVLRHVGVMLGEELRATDTLARIGGDEFAAVLRDCRLLDACSIAENIRAAIERYEYVGERGHQRVEVSIGLLELAARHQSPEDALHEVDSACYEAKRAGRNRVWVYAADDSGDPGPLVAGT